MSLHKIFLIDGIGACLSVLFLGLLLPSFESYFGMPKNVLYGLAILASLLAIFSLSCYFFNVKNGRLFLKIVAFANILYCCISLGLMLYFYQKLTTLGFVYFLGEKIVVLILVYFELKMAKINDTRFTIL